MAQTVVAEHGARRQAVTVVATAAGTLAVIGLWQLIGATKAVGTSVSPPTKVLHAYFGTSNGSAINRAALITAREALEGFGWGVLLAVVFGVLVVTVPVLRRGIDQLATIQSAIPFVALAPILLANFAQSTIPAAMAAATAFFTLYVATVAGLGAASRSLSDVFAVLGASRIQRLWRIQVPAALPVVATALKVAMPLAIVGAVVGEWLGASGGIGPLLLLAMRDYQMPVMWAAAAAIVVVALVLFGAMAALERVAMARFGGAS